MMILYRRAMTILFTAKLMLSGCTRPTDHLARSGGEEFAVILSGIRQY